MASNFSFFWMFGTMVTVGLAANQTVAPSAAAVLVSSPASAPLAPGLFSTITLAPSSLASAGAKMRAMASTGPPAA